MPYASHEGGEKKSGFYREYFEIIPEFSTGWMELGK